MMVAGAAEFEQSGEGVLPAELAASLIHLLDCAKRYLDEDREKAEASIARAASLLQVEFDRRNADADEGPSRGALVAWQVNRVRAYVDARLATSIRTRDLAAVARRSTTYFSRAFKATFGETPHAFVVSQRLHRAAELMLTSDDSLSQVALACGFVDQAHLCKMFRQRHGQSPAVWRRQRRDVSSRAARAVPFSPWLKLDLQSRHRQIAPLSGPPSVKKTEHGDEAERDRGKEDRGGDR